jgi:uncharacterized membrane protein YedE/YeeE
MKRYSDPYLAGAGIGLVLLASYAVAGRGLGASGAFSSVAAALSAGLAGGVSPATAPYLPEGLSSPLRDWLVLELAGVALGGFASAWLAGRRRLMIERGPGIGNKQRIMAGFAGGMFMGFGAKLARGCTSGQALTGGALLSVGSWIFIGACFAAGYVAAPLARRLWR